jgi:hypothetical protein
MPTQRIPEVDEHMEGSPAKNQTGSIYGQYFQPARRAGAGIELSPKAMSENRFNI